MNIFEAITTYAKKDFTNFGMSNNWLGSVRGFGELTCIYHDICIAADTWKMAHNVLVKLPPLVAPAFTRIKAVINTFYVSYASVWKHWNSFISDKPDDTFLNRSLLKGYKGRFVEPCCDMRILSCICKMAKGNFYYNYDDLVEIDSKSYHKIGLLYNKSKTSLNKGYTDSYRTITWTLENGLRRAVASVRHSDSSVDLNEGNASLLNDYGLEEIFSAFDYRKLFYSREVSFEYSSLGFYDNFSYLIYCCESVVRNLEAHGVPCDLIANTRLGFYTGDYFNLLPFICESSIWQNFYRDEQNQSPEFDYSEVNGMLTEDGNIYSGWKIRLNGLPLNTSSVEPLWFNINELYKAFSLLTGYYLRDTVQAELGLVSSDNISILPSHYNGLLLTRYRNFEKDYFTSACVDPMMGAVSVSTPSTIEALRTASKLEEFLERSASARDFYNFMKYNFGTNPESTRYKKPLLLGTKVIPIQISEQLQTSETSNTPLGERAGVADAYGNGGTCDHYFNEHGHIVSFISFVLDSQYMQGLPHQFEHHLQLDYPFPDFSNLGAESIPTKEIYYGDYDSLNYNPNSKFNNVAVAKLLSGNVTVEAQYPSQFTSVFTEGVDISDFAYIGLNAYFSSRRLERFSSSSLRLVPDGNLQFSSHAGDTAVVRQTYNLLMTIDGAGALLRDANITQNVASYVLMYRSGIKVSYNSSDSDIDLGYGVGVYSESEEEFVQGESKVFGYVPRYSRWKFKLDTVCGQMRNDLEFWHTFRQFSQIPYIGHNFVSYEDAGFVSNLNRIFAVENDNADKFYLDIFNNCSVRRCLPLVANPSLD